MKHLNEYDLIFWDFDGVIKDSVGVKGEAFKTLFADYGNKVQEKIYCHHIENGGMSRHQKIPIYLSFANLNFDDKIINSFLNSFSKIVMKKVIESDWVDGAKEYLDLNNKKQLFVLVTATPQKEIELILDELQINHFFRKIYGSPMSKEECISDYLTISKIELDKAIMIGDSIHDYNAASKNNIKFFLRNTNYNFNFVSNLDDIECSVFDNFNKFIF